MTKDYLAEHRIAIPSNKRTFLWWLKEGLLCAANINEVGLNGTIPEQFHNIYPVSKLSGKKLFSKLCPTYYLLLHGIETHLWRKKNLCSFRREDSQQWAIAKRRCKRRRSGTQKRKLSLFPLRAKKASSPFSSPEKHNAQKNTLKRTSFFFLFYLQPFPPFALSPVVSVNKWDF